MNELLIRQCTCVMCCNEIWCVHRRALCKQNFEAGQQTINPRTSLPISSETYFAGVLKFKTRNVLLSRNGVLSSVTIN